MQTISNTQFQKAVNNVENILTPILQRNGFSWKFIAGDQVHETFAIQQVIDKNTPEGRVRGKVGLMGEIIELKNPVNRILVQPFYLKNILDRIDKPNSNIPSTFIERWEKDITMLKLNWYQFLSSINLHFLLYNDRFFVLDRYDTFPEQNYSLKYRHKKEKLDRLYLRKNTLPARSLKYLKPRINKLTQ